jgi:hypothetical protein
MFVEYFLGTIAALLIVGVLVGGAATTCGPFIAEFLALHSGRTLHGKLVNEQDRAFKLANGTVRIIGQPIYHEGMKQGCNYTLKRAWFESAWFATPDLEADKMDAIRAQIERDLAG